MKDQMGHPVAEGDRVLYVSLRAVGLADGIITQLADPFVQIRSGVYTTWRRSAEVVVYPKA